MATPAGLPPIDVYTMSTGQLQRAWCLMLTVSLFPTITHDKALPIAQWIFENKTKAGS